MVSPRSKPNILMTGTPGTGKTSTSEAVARETGYQHVNVGQWVKDRQLHSGWNEEHQCFMIDEDKVCDELEDVMAEGGVLVDHHGCDFFPERWFDLVVVLQAETSVLYDRLQQRGYDAKKVSENVECEIMMVVLEEATESYAKGIVQALSSNTAEELERNVQQVVAWIKANTRAE